MKIFSKNPLQSAIILFLASVLNFAQPCYGALTSGAVTAVVAATTLGVGTALSLVSGKSNSDTEVSAARLSRIVVAQSTPTTSPVSAGLTAQFTATAVYSDDSTKDITTQVVWSSSDLGVATIVADTGLATTKKAGQVSISASLSGVTGTATLTVSKAALSSIEVKTGSATVPAGISANFTATGTFADGTTEDITNSVVWASANTDVATINASTGVVTCIKTGASNITATVGTIVGIKTLTVSAANLVSITVTLTKNSLKMGFPTTVSATGTYSDNSTHDITASVVWNSSDLSVAKVTTAGKVITMAEGAATISASLSGINSTDPNPTLTVVSWQKLNTSLVAVDVPALAVNGNTLYAGTQLAGVWTVGVPPEGDGPAPASIQLSLVGLQGGILTAVYIGNGNTWCAVNGQLYYYVGIGNGWMKASVGSVTATTAAVNVISSLSGCLYLGTYGGGTYFMANGNLGILTGSTSDVVYSMYNMGSTLYIGANSGVYPYTGGTSLPAVQSTGLTGGATALSSIGDVLYVGSGSNGVYTYVNGSFTPMNAGLTTTNSRIVRSLCAMDGSLFVGTVDGIYIYNGEQWVKICTSDWGLSTLSFATIGSTLYYGVNTGGANTGGVYLLR